MKISYRWLSQYLTIHATPEQLANKLRTATCEVESITDLATQLAGLVTGKVITVVKHPKADRLRIASVKVGPETKTIVCGAPNLEVGQTVVVALPGVTLHPLKGETFTIGEAVLRGQKSEGMLCAAEEIGLPLAMEGIFILDPSIPSGLPLTEILDLNDTILDLEITPNRPDLLSYKGIAREVSTFEKKNLVELAIYTTDEDTETHAETVTLSLEDNKLSSRFSALIISNITVETSPLWLQLRLSLSGIKPVNTVVDVTNYVMLELGQPLHAYDFHKLSQDSKPSLKVRVARKDEIITLLDHSTRELSSDDIVISDNQNKVISIAGIMGGSTTEISEITTKIVLESAHFDGAHIRRTSRRLGLRSEASTRFEKGLDPEGTVTALKRAAYLLQHISDAKVSSNLLDLYPKNRLERPRIHLSFARAQQILGVHISAAEAKSILQHLGFQIPSLTKSSLEVIPPTWRKDITLPEDVVEELIRMWGFDRLSPTLPSGEIKAPVVNTFFKDKTTIRHGLAALGFRETIHLSFTSEPTLKKIGFDQSACIKIQKPLSSETEYLVPNHIVSFLENCASVNLHEKELQLFEIGHIFLAPKVEQECVSGLIRSDRPAEALLSEAKGTILRILQLIQRFDSSISFTSANPPKDIPFMDSQTFLNIYFQDTQIGYLGLVNPTIVQSLKIRSGQNVLQYSLNLDILLSLPTVHHSYVPPRSYPSIERDITVIVEDSLPIKNIEEVLQAHTDPDILLDSSIPTIYRGKPLEASKKSVTIHFIYNHRERTLTDQEVSDHQALLIRIFKSTLAATITE